MLQAYIKEHLNISNGAIGTRLFLETAETVHSKFGAVNFNEKVLSHKKVQPN
jgi:hypothetical protein